MLRIAQRLKTLGAAAALLLAMGLAGCQPAEKPASEEKEKPAAAKQETQAPQPADGAALHLNFDTQAAELKAAGTAPVPFKVSNATFVPQGHEGGAIAFDPAQKAYAVAEKAVIDPRKDFTLSLWLNPAQPVTVRQTVFAETNPRNANPAFTITANGRNNAYRVSIFLRDNAGKVLVDKTAPDVFRAGQWAHLVLTHQSGVMRLAMNGKTVLDNIAVPAGAVDLARTSLGAVLRPLPIYPYTGMVDELKIYDKALDAAKTQ